jgi:hypothetical protein
MNIKQLVVSTAASALLLGATVMPAFAADFFQGFETDIAGWETPTRVPTGTNSISSSDGLFHATTPSAAGDFTRWGGYNYGAGNAVPTVFKEYVTSVDIYLNVAGGWTNNTRFDFSSAINNSAGTHLSDFIFNAGFYDDGTGPGANTDRFVVSASYNSQPGSAFAKNPGFDPIAISTTGWYTFEHHFYDNAGVLNVDMSIYDASHTLIKTWTRVSSAITGVGGNRYGWFDFNEFSTLAFDNTSLSVITAPSVPTITTPVDGAVVNVSSMVKVDWTDSTGGTAPILYQYQAFSDSTYASLLYDSGMTLSASEIPTPGTSPGVYYVRVRAQGAVGPVSEWSNGVLTPHMITVIADPVLVGPPVEKDQCKKDGWMTFNNPTFKNQGDCVSYVQSNANALGNKNK